jgi:NAD(P)-dependent dehydrogenase (short-subunit alcohol dehydrogenase family)
MHFTKTAGGIAMITGAGSGIGEACALALAGAGWSLVLAGRRAQPLQRVAETIRSSGGEALPVCADVSDPTAVDRLFSSVRDQFGRLDLLFNNAGTGAPAVSLEDLPLDAWRHVIDVNLTGSFLCTQAAFRLMKSQAPRGGRIINNGSLSAHVPRPRSVAYTATKHAVTGLTRSTALDGRAYDIACGQIDIGNAATSLTAAMSHGVAQPGGDMMAEPVIDVRHVADAILYMAGLPLDANVQFMTVMATRMPFIGRG